MLKRYVTFPLLALAVAACDSSTSGERAIPAVEETVFAEMSSTIDRARGVEDLNLQRKNELDRALEADEH